MDEQTEKPNNLYIYGIANIGCKMDNVTFQTIVQEKPHPLNPQEEAPVDATVEEGRYAEEAPAAADETLSDTKRSVVERLLELADKGDWREDGTAEIVKTMLKSVLGLNDKLKLTAKQDVLSGKLWRLLENGRGDRVKIVWQNLVGYLDDRKLFKQKGSPALNIDFFGNEDGYTNIDKGRPSRDIMSTGFREVLPLLDAFAP